MRIVPSNEESQEFFVICCCANLTFGVRCIGAIALGKPVVLGLLYVS